METQTTDTVETTTSDSGVTPTVKQEVTEEFFTQDQVNKIVAKRVKEIKKQYEDYETLKQSVEDLQAKLNQFQDEKKMLESKYSETVFNSILESTAKELNLDTELAAKLLERDKIIVQDEKPSNIKELLQALIEKHPNLVRKAVVTPQVPTSTETDKPKFSLHNTPNTSKFFSGGGLRLNHIKDNS